MKRILQTLLIILIFSSLSACNAPKTQNNPIKAENVSPKDLIIGNWIKEDMVYDGKSAISAKMKNEMKNNPEEMFIYAFEKDKVKIFFLGKWEYDTYEWLNNSQIKIIPIDAKDKYSSNTVNIIELTTDSLRVSSPYEKSTVHVFKKYTGELPKETTPQQKP